MTSETALPARGPSWTPPCVTSASWSVHSHSGVLAKPVAPGSSVGPASGVPDAVTAAAKAPPEGSSGCRPRLRLRLSRARLRRSRVDVPREGVQGRRQTAVDQPGRRRRCAGQGREVLPVDLPAGRQGAVPAQVFQLGGRGRGAERRDRLETVVEAVGVADHAVAEAEQRARALDRQVRRVVGLVQPQVRALDEALVLPLRAGQDQVHRGRPEDTGQDVVQDDPLPVPADECCAASKALAAPGTMDGSASTRGRTVLWKSMQAS